MNVNLLRTAARSKAVLIGGIIVLAVVLAAILAPLLSTHDPYEMNVKERLLDPLEGGHLLGTDQFGRDLYTRILYGAQVSLEVGIVSVSLALVIGVTLGLISGYYGGWIDTVIMRFVDIVLSFPVLLLAIAFVAALGPGIENVIIALALVYWTSYARLVRATVLSIKEEEYVQAARTIGSSDFRIIVYNILPNCLAPIIVVATLGLGQAIVAEATLSFLGLGIQPPESSWGWTLAFGMKFLQDAPHLSIYPGVAIMLTVLGFNLLGDGIRDLTDTKLKQK
ncbi:nickel transporter permease [Brevibacillus centrosporus]|uniref:Peptide/nickel transport system permease protein n=1 Tax=Brevibacillus centrosporus TaxID=54910 RepID=A0A1I3QQD4_9BACL|nr:nickel transporter permease [Brevibacillus centrosporus]MEC2129463.1 ABC transporter permease [Brevibacillus centrosporus]MED4908888.1 ABC transporter permease [Brevibacillus centrosporus]RNB65538.1 ABC transporter permease [Brevibacillus centrosporus]SFJ35366.1 peptide/nickel transport system permease protein [Brevibacillus centrosporus]GED29814.1 nickel ABC transporter permease [Brevibacillus centrosporus]